MSLPPALQDREYQKFGVNETDEVYVRTSATGTLQIKGLSIGGRYTEVEINDTTWVALPVIPLPNRNTICIQNYSGQSIKINYGNDIIGFVGTFIADGSERVYDITGDIILYGKCQSGTAIIGVEELA